MRRVFGVVSIALTVWAGCRWGSSDITVGDVPDAAEGVSDGAVPGAADVGPVGESSVGDGSAIPPFDAWGSPCIGAEHYFCDDFDGDAGFTRWDNRLITDGGAIEIVGSGITPPSAPQVVSVRAFPRSEGAAQMHTYLAPHGLHCEMAVAVMQRGADEAMALAVRVGSPVASPPFYQLELDLRSGGSDAFTESGLLADGGMLMPFRTGVTAFQTGQWVQVSLELAFGAQAKLSAKINGVEVVPRAHYNLAQFAQPTHEMLTMGIVAGDGGASWSALFDNAVCDPLP